nr:hypothetical protein [Catenulispora rubra]
MSHARAQHPHAAQQRLCAVAVEHRGGGDQHGQQQTERVDGDMPLRAVDLLPGVVATLLGADSLGGAQRLGIDDRSGGFGLAAVGDADRAALPVVRQGGQTLVAPATEEPVNRVPRRKVDRQRPPFDPV